MVSAWPVDFLRGFPADWDFMRPTTSFRGSEHARRADRSYHPQVTSDFLVQLDDAATAALRLPPARCFAALKKTVGEAVTREMSQWLRALIDALATARHPLDKGWFAALAPCLAPLGRRWHSASHAVVGFFARERCAEAEAVLARFLDARVDRAAGWCVPVYDLLGSHWRDGCMNALVLRAVEAAVRTTKVTFQLTQPLAILQMTGDGSVVPELERIAARAKPLARRAILETASRVAKTARLPAAAPPRPARLRQRDGEILDPERGAMLGRLLEVGFERAVAAKVVARCRETIRLLAAPAKAVKPGGSRLGGTPDLPPKTAWPTVRGSAAELKRKLKTGDLDEVPHTKDGAGIAIPLEFAGQINLSELAALAPSGPLPAGGLLSFFVQDDVVVGRAGELTKVAAAVLYTPAGAKLRPQAPPRELARRSHPTCSLKLARLLQWPDEDALGDVLTPAERDRLASLPRDKEPAGRHAMLGYARCRYYRGLPRPRDTLLLELASDPAPRFTWGDGSSIFFCVPTKELAAGHLEAAFCLDDE